jgi:hypothetical protein
MMRLHWSPKSPYVRKVMVCAHELQPIDEVQLMGADHHLADIG